jgi:hypothetical protein
MLTRRALLKGELTTLIILVAKRSASAQISPALGGTAASPWGTYSRIESVPARLAAPACRLQSISGVYAGPTHRAPELRRSSTGAALLPVGVGGGARSLCVG